MLLDNKGHAEWEMADSLGVEDSNLNPILKKLEEKKLICNGNIRLSQRQREKNEGIYAEIPYNLSQDLDNFKALIREVSEANRPYDFGFLMEIIDNSKYLKLMKEQYKEKISAIVNEELSKCNSPYSDPFFNKVIKPELVEELFCNLEQLLKPEIRA
jgi:predicted transcriptional regulator